MLNICCRTSRSLRSVVITAGILLLAKIAGASEPALAVYKNVFITFRVYDNRYKYTFKIDGIGKPIQLVLGESPAADSAHLARRQIR